MIEAFLTSVSHGQRAAAVAVDEVLVLELLAVNASAASAVAVGGIATLGHEVSDDSVEWNLVVLSSLAELFEVSSGLGNLIGEETKLHFDHLVAHLDIHRHLVRDARIGD